MPALGVVALLATGCGGWRDEQAAKVDTATVSMASLRGEVAELADRPDLATAFNVAGTGSVPADESTQSLVNWLSRRITDLTISEELARRGITVDADGLAAGEASLRLQLELYEQQAAQMGAQPSTPTAQFDALSPELRSALIAREANRQALAGALAEEAGRPVPATARAWYDANRADYEQVCLAAVVTQDQGSALAARQRVESGTPFATVASEESIDTATAAEGGDAGCIFEAQLNPDLAQLLAGVQPGGLVGPTQLNNGWFVIQVSDRGTATFEEAEQTAASDRLVALQEAFGTWIEEADPDVTVSPRLGTWDAEAFQVVPNPGPAPAPAGAA